MPFQIDYIDQPPHVRVTGRGSCSHEEILAAMHDFFPNPRTSELREVLWDMRQAVVDLSPEQLREEVHLMGEYRKRIGWGISIAVTAHPAEAELCRKGAAYADLEHLEERIQVCATLEEALAMLDDIQQRFRHHDREARSPVPPA